MFRMRFAGSTALALSLVAVTQLSCGHERGAVHNAAAEAVAGVSQRLNGRWVLVSFKPDLPVETALQLLLNDQFEHLVVTLSGNTLHAQGPGVDFTRTFRIAEAYGDHFNATVYDSYGVGIESVCDFNGNTLLVNGATDPWRGRSIFRRVP
jgi:hypothetical protein